jgi:hypothetical protein
MKRLRPVLIIAATAVLGLMVWLLFLRDGEALTLTGYVEGERVYLARRSPDRSRPCARGRAGGGGRPHLPDRPEHPASPGRGAATVSATARPEPERASAEGCRC